MTNTTPTVASVEAGSRAPMTHDLKTWPEHFLAVKTGRKRFEARLNDRDFQVGDTLRLNEFHPSAHHYTGDSVAVLVTHVLHGGAFGIADGNVVMSIAFPSDRATDSLRAELIDSCVWELEAHHEWLVEHPDEPDDGPEWIEVHPDRLLSLLRAENATSKALSQPVGSEG